MGYLTLDKIVRGAIANKGHSVLHLYIPYLMWAFRGLNKFQEEGVFTNLKSTSDYLDANNCLPLPEDFKMWCKVGIVSSGKVHAFINEESLSLDPADFSPKETEDAMRGLFSYNSSAAGLLYNSNIYVSTENGLVALSGGGKNKFKINWEAQKIQVMNPVKNTKVYLEYVSTGFDPTTETLVNELALEYIEAFIYYREARFKHGAAHRETRALEMEWLNEQDEIGAKLSDLSADGIIHARNASTRHSIDQ